MRLIPLDQIPNQQFIVTLDGSLWEITIKETAGTMAATVIRDNVTLVEGQRIAAGTPLIPYRHLQAGGNFIFLTVADALPYWDRFTVDQLLIYATTAEVAAAPVPGLTWPDLTGVVAVPILPTLRITTTGQVRITTDDAQRIVAGV